MSISKQIIFSSTLVGLLALFAGFVGWKNMHAIKSNVHTCMENSLEISAGLRGVQGNMIEIHKWFLSPAKPTSINGLVEELDKNIALVKNLSPTLESDLQQVKSKYEYMAQKFVHLPINDYVEELRVNTFRGEALLREAHKANSLAIVSQAEDLNANIKNLSFWIISICLLVFALAIIFGQVIARALSKSLLKLEQVAGQIKDGNFSDRIEIGAKNEFGYLAKSFNLLAESAEQAELIQDQNDQLEVLNQELKIKNDSLDSFVYRVSHDLKAPLINLVSLQNIIKNKIQGIKDKKIHRTMDYIFDNTNRLQNTIQDLLEVSRIERGLRQSKEWVSISSTIQKVLSENSESINQTNTDIDLDIAVDKVFISPTNLLSIFSNLINNAIKYRKPKGENIIRIKSYSQDSFTIIEIVDNGIGIDLEKHHKKLFGIFNRFHNHVEGSGVGLYIVKKIVSENKGQISLESKVDLGTSFRIQLPDPAIENKLSADAKTLAEMNN